VNIIGRLCADVGPRYTTTTHRAMARMPVAVNDRYGENQRVYWFSVICWNGLAETVIACPHKGSRIARRHIISDINEDEWGCFRIP